MSDLTTISTTLGSVKAAIDIAKLIRDSSTSLEQAEIKLKMAELISALADAKMNIAEIQGLLLDKDREIQGLQSQLTTRKNVTYEAPAYFVIEGQSKDGPFCQRCYDKDSALIRLQVSSYYFEGTNHVNYQCRACGSGFSPKS